MAYRRSGDPGRAATVAFTWLTHLDPAVVLNAFEHGGNERIRFLVDPFGMTILALTISAGFERLLRRARQRPDGGA